MVIINIVILWWWLFFDSHKQCFQVSIVKGSHINTLYHQVSEFFFIYLVLLFWDRVLLYSLSWSQTYYVVLASLGLSILLSYSPKCRNYRHMSPHPAGIFFFLIYLWRFVVNFVSLLTNHAEHFFHASLHWLSVSPYSLFISCVYYLNY
jgi:hypothetical protein